MCDIPARPQSLNDLRDHLPVSSSTPGPAGRCHLPNNSTVAGGPTRGDDIIGEATSRTGSRPCVSGAVRRSISLQTAGQLRPHPCHNIARTQHHRFQELTPCSTTPAPLPSGHRTTAMDIRPLQATSLRRNTPATHLPSRCHHRLEVPGQADWNFSSGQSQALRAQYVPPGEFVSSDFNGWGAEEGGVGSSYLPSAFVGQPVDIEQVDNVWIGDSGATTHMTRNADMMYYTRPRSLHRPRIILGDGSIKKVHFVGKIDLVFHSRTDHQVTLHGVSYVPDLGFNLF